MAYNEKNSSNRTKEASQTRKEHDPEHFLKWVKRVVLQTKNNNKINF
ncbi:hypothetical protein KCX61_05885 [Francisella tularensis]|nr:hypothetical protein [Francisella tularensis]QXF53674.1 hypothetical protein KCX61_05885 [Francisella tularensis]